MLAVISVNIVLLAVVVLIVYLIFKRRLKILIDEMTLGLKNILKESTEPVQVLNLNNDVRKFYEELSSVKTDMSKREKTRQEILNIINSVAVNMEFDKLLDDLLPKLIDITKSTCCAFYSFNSSTNKLEIKASQGFTKNIYSEFDITLGEGFIGKAAVEKNVTIHMDIPDDTVYVIRTFLGKVKPKSIMIVPINYQEQFMGVLVFANIDKYTDDQAELIGLIKYYFGIAVVNGSSYEKTKRLTNELRFQNKLIQNLNEDLEKKVQERTVFLNDILDSITDHAIYSMSKDGIISMWNKGAENLMGFKAEEVIGRHVEVIHSKDEIDLVGKRLKTVLRDGMYTESGYRTKRDGSKYFYELNLFCVYDEKKEVVGISNITRDITASKLFETAQWCSNELINKILNENGYTIIVTNDRGVILRASEEAEQILEADGIVGRGIFEFFDDWRRLYDNIKRVEYNGAKETWTYSLKDKQQQIELVVYGFYEETAKIKNIFFIFAA